MAHSTRVVLVLVLLGFGLFVSERSVHAGTYGLADVTLLPMPPNTFLTSFDISWIDPDSQRYYLADRSNAAIEIVNAQDHTFIGQITGFVGVRPGAGTSGPNGVVVLPKLNQLWAGDGDSTVKVVDLTSGTILDTINTRGTNRADELAYDPEDGLILVANDAETPPFVTLISTQDGHAIVGQIPFDATTVPDGSLAGTTGLEQPVWEPITERFYQAVPATTAYPGGAIAVIDPRAMAVEQVFDVEACNPHGLALGPDFHLLLGCSGSDIPNGTPLQSLILDAIHGTLVATLPQIGGSDEVWFNPRDQHYYLAANNWTATGLKGGALLPALGIVDADTNTWLENVPTIMGAHSVAANPVTNEIFVPLTNVGIGVYAPVSTPQAALSTH
jgi:DNA-binding beta-propeller fold protein YncE